MNQKDKIEKNKDTGQKNSPNTKNQNNTTNQKNNIECSDTDTEKKNWQKFKINFRKKII